MVRVKGKIFIFNKTKNKVDYVKDNFVTSLGKSFIAERMIDNSYNYIDYLGIGNGVGVHSDTSTTLFNEVFRKKIETKSSPDNKVILTTPIMGDEALGDWTEMGLFDSETDGILTNVVNVSYTHNQGDELEINWEITVL